MPMSRGPVCRGFLIEVGAPLLARARRDTLARTVVKRALRGRWKTVSLGAHSRWYEVTPRPRQLLAPARAWETVHHLKQDRDVQRAEPALVTSGLQPADPGDLTPRERLRRSARSKSGGGDAHLPGSNHPEWSLDNTRVTRAWHAPLPKHRGGRRFGAGIVIGHPDTGYTMHPEVWNNPRGKNRVRALAGRDYVDERSNPVDPLAPGHPGHGTRTASVIMSDAGPARATGWVSGTAPAATLVPYRVITSVVVFDFGNVARAIHHAVDNGCHVISMSLGGPIGSGAVEEAVRHAVQRDVIVLAAAGNVWPWVVHPARLDHVIAVAASNCNDRPWASSASGDAVDVSAPGESVWRAETQSHRGYTVGRGNGTSFAVATLAGITALWLAHHGRERLIGQFGAGQLVSAYKNLLVTHGVRRPPGWDASRYGAGIVDAERLLRAPLPARGRSRGASAVPKAARSRGAHADVVADLAHLLPGTSPVALRAALSRVLHERGSLDDVLAGVGDELVFHVACDTAFRASLQETRRSKARTRRSITPRHASRVFRHYIGRP